MPRGVDNCVSVFRIISGIMDEAAEAAAVTAVSVGCAAAEAAFNAAQ